ncbi:hypothetical protein BFG57_17285 [Bacillus solimangrovi]|uniref:Uncharacterized protein n=1 Tax=Bacillus solimangrovi TaxID=1305675 RepID=A0A1E5LD49_9BACI|nr:hypothetical protein BFG57_17285 [Bacillus solimangrovi]
MREYLRRKHGKQNIKQFTTKKSFFYEVDKSRESKNTKLNKETTVYNQRLSLYSCGNDHYTGLIGIVFRVNLIF